MSVVSNAPSPPCEVGSVVAVDVEVLKPRTQEGDFPEDEGRQPPLNPEQPVLYHDEGRYVVVSKPADVRMDGEFMHTVEKLIHARIGVEKSSGLRFVQRLDYATSGVLLAALTKRAAAHAGAQFEARTVSKRYIALVHGDPPEKALWTWRVGYVHPDGFVMRCYDEDSDDGRTASTEMQVHRRGRYHSAPVALVQLTPASGRRHQLRVHCENAGFPIVGDATYIPDEDERYFTSLKKFEPPRMMLHAQSLSIMLPPKGVEVRGKKASRVIKQFEEQTFESQCDFLELDGLVWNAAV